MFLGRPVLARKSSRLNNEERDAANQSLVAMPAGARPLSRLLLRLLCRRVQHGQFDVFEANFHGAARVHLEAEDAAAADELVIQIDAQFAVDPGSYMIAVRFHHI